MKLQKHFSRRVGNKAYNKWVVVLPSKQVNALGWEEGEYLESKVNDEELIIRRENPEKAKKRSKAAKKAWKTRRKHEANE